MTDSEIIKAFELCFVNFGCKQCPYFYNNKCNEQGELPKKTLEVLNRQKEEIERLKEIEFMYNDLCR